jgi:hypothetical protein
MKDDLENLRLDAPMTADSKVLITLNDFLKQFLKQPVHETETLRLNATNILKVLGVPNVGMTEAKVTNKWLRTNGYRAVHNGKVFKVAVVYPQTSNYLIVF